MIMEDLAVNKALLKASLILLSIPLGGCALNGPSTPNTSTAYAPDMRQYVSKDIEEMGNGPAGNPGMLASAAPKASAEPIANISRSGAGGSMDSADRMKMSRALDNPPGKSSHWVNPSSGVSYTLVPTHKVVMNGNPYCRQYTLTATGSGGSSHQSTGTACVSSDGSWQAVSGG